jgi:uncharacterized membrane protein YgcG
MRIAFLARFVVICAALFCWATGTRAQTEQILDFHSDLTLQEDATLQVTETITVVAAGRQIRHGIYRDFPTHYRDNLGNRYDVGFQMLSATRDSADEAFRVEGLSNGKRIYLGSSDAYVPGGQHVYTLTYTTNRQLGFFKDHDELFWNVTGLGWAFSIQHASATVHLPAAIPASEVTLSGFTGPQGSREAALTATSEDSSLQFEATRAFRAHEGLSVVLMWPKGYVAEPTFNQKVNFFFRDNADALFLAGGFLFLFLYYVLVWASVGRDPKRGVIMAQYEPPQGLSPAAMRYLMRMGFDNKTFAAAVLDMAVRGFLSIKQQAGSYTLYATGKDQGVLSPDEKEVAARLFDGRKEIWLHNENHQAIQAALAALKKWLKNAEQKTYFVTNSRYMVLPIILSVVVVIGYLLAQGKSSMAGMGVFISVWLSFWTIGVVGILSMVFNRWRAALGFQPSTLAGVGNIGGAVFLTLFAVPFVLGEIFGLGMLLRFTSVTLVFFLLTAGFMHVLFFHLLKAPTFAGRRLMDQVQGFKLFLGAVDTDRLNRAAPPEQTPSVFEKFLPYALALDVEQHWAEKFSGVLAIAGSMPSNADGYTPTFYSSSAVSGFTAASFAAALSSSLTSAISSASTAPGSAGGGGGGGGSGGGGGGGGGGGW